MSGLGDRTMKILLLMLCLVLGPLSPAFGQTLHFLTEEYAPFNYSKGGAITGIAVDQMRIIAERAGVDYTLEMMPWARAFSLAENQPMHCVFTTGYNRERAGRFVWITPLLKDQMVMIRRKGAAHKNLTIVEARELKVGSQRGDFAIEALELIGFRNIDLAADIDITIRKLLSGRIDLMPTSAKAYERMVKDGLPVEQAMLLAGQVYGVACHRDTPPDLVKRLQAELDKLIQSGEQDGIFAAYGLPPNPRTADSRRKK